MAGAEEPNLTPAGDLINPVPPIAQEASAEGDPHQHRHPAQARTVGVLAAAQVLGGLGVGAAVAVGSLIAAGVTGSEAAAGLAQTTAVVGAAVAAIPLVRVTNRLGRRAGLSTGMAVAAVGAALVVMSASRGWTVLLFLGFLLTGAATAAGLQARYAATDLATDRHRARDLSIVVWATTVGAVAGPNLADPAGRVAVALGLPQLTGAYLLALVALTLGGLLILIGLHPDPLLTARIRAHDRGTPHSAHPTFRHSMRIIRASPAALLALAAIAVGHTSMVAVMVMTPIHMAHVDVSLVIIGLVISVHILGMYALSPLVGLASDRYGRRPVIAVGAGTLLAACLIAGTAPADDARLLGLGLFLLGLGWSCGLVAGSTLLTESVPEHERPGAQGASDVVMNVCAALGGAIAGIVVAVASYGLLCTLAAIPVLVLIVWLMREGRTGPESGVSAPARDASGR